MSDRRIVSDADVAAPAGLAMIVAPATIMAGSLITIVPVVATVPLLPPFGLLMLLAWRLRGPDVFRSWVPVPRGLFDDRVIAISR